MRTEWSTEALGYSFGSVCIVLVGAILLGFIFSYIRQFAARHNPFGANLINYGTIPGVMHHELSHALLAFLTGAKIKEIKLFQFNHSSGALGYVSYATRGNFIVQSIQKVLASVAPIICGFISCSLLWYYVRPMTVDNVWASVFFYYFLICIVLHMSLSKQDIKVMKSGLLVIVILLTIIFYVAGINLVTPIMSAL